MLFDVHLGHNIPICLVNYLLFLKFFILSSRFFLQLLSFLQWLVKHSIERRRETEQYNRSFAVRLYEKKMNSTSNKVMENKEDVRSAADKIFKNITNLEVNICFVNFHEKQTVHCC